MKTMEFMESIREMTEKKSWYAVARILETDETTISRIRKGEKHPSTEMCFRIAELLELDPAEVVSAVEMEHAKSEEKKEFWKGHFFRHSKAAGIAVISGFIGICGAAGISLDQGIVGTKIVITSHYAK